jgi:hypothetical protein
MQPIEIPKFPTLHGKKAIKALRDFINELETQECKELTENQTKALIKLAKGLITSIEAETHSNTCSSSVKEMLFEGQLKKTISRIYPALRQQVFK